MAMTYIGLDSFIACDFAIHFWKLLQLNRLCGVGGLDEVRDQSHQALTGKYLPAILDDPVLKSSHQKSIGELEQCHIDSQRLFIHTILPQASDVEPKYQPSKILNIDIVQGLSAC